ncbi:suppressor of fused domain protein [Sphaerisporangium perillae]|uniref:suppressor of fused domain protein n=1 Tax=Sphaerisporangium perillae TaxID=2935860 RepID=UPI00355652FC
MNDNSADEYLAHFERSLGTFSESWRKSDIDTEHFQVLQFCDRESERITYVTFGLNRFELALGSNRVGRQELVVGIGSSWDQPEIPGLMNSIGESVVHRGRALLRGEVLDPHGRIFRGYNFTAFYCSSPVYFPRRFEVFHGTTPETIMVWLIPIFSEEVQCIRERGWPAFEELLESQDPNLLDLSRVPLNMKG